MQPKFKVISKNGIPIRKFQPYSKIKTKPRFEESSRLHSTSKQGRTQTFDMSLPQRNHLGDTQAQRNHQGYTWSQRG